MRKITVSALLIVLFLMAGCRSKKKISNISKGYDVEYQESKTDTKIEDTKVTNTDTKEKETVKETYDRQTVEEYIFGDDGRVQGYTKTTNEKGAKDTDRNKESSAKDSTTTNTATSSSEAKGKEVATETESTVQETEKKRNPIRNWIGAGVFIVIIGYAFWKLVLKR